MLKVFFCIHYLQLFRLFVRRIEHSSYIMQLYKNIFIFPDEISHYGPCTHKLLLTFISSR